MSKYDQCHSGNEQQCKVSILQYRGWGTAALLLLWVIWFYAKSLLLYRSAGWVESWVFVYLLLFVLLHPSTPPPAPPRWCPRPSLKEKWRIWPVWKTGKLTLHLLETNHSTPRWKRRSPVGTTTSCVHRKTTTGIPPTGNTDGQEKTTQAGAGRESSAQGEQTRSRRGLVSHLVNEIPHTASLYFGRV